MYDIKINRIFEYISQLKQTMKFEDKLLLLANMAKDIIETDRCSIWSFDAKRGQFISKVAHGVDVLELDMSDGIVGHSFLFRETMIFDDVYESEFFDPKIDQKTGYRTKSMITMPIVNSHGDAIGVFQALNKLSGDETFKEDDIKLLDLITAYIAEVLESSILYDQLEIKKQEVENINENLEKLVENRTAELKKEKENAENANKAKSEFLANMSHEIRTPLNAILGFLDILKEQEEDSDKLKYITTISNNSKTLLNTINDILDFSKIESGELQIENISFNLIAEVNNSIDLFHAAANEKNITLHLSIEKNNMPDMLISDPYRLKQIISNLLSNAIKFTSKDKNVYIKVSFKDEKLTLSIKDEGIGINEDKKESIFNPFTQADSSTTRKYGGTGLGLAISNKLIELLGGKLQLKTKVEEGSEFYFSIPAKVAKQKKDQIDVEDLKDLNAHILLVEDNISNQMFMKVLLKKIGVTFDIANDGLEAIEAFKNNKYDIILMDENMPNMNGIEATHRILDMEKQQNTIHTPIIALTANALKGDREKFINAGMDEYLTKPVNKKLLMQTIKNLKG